MARGDIILVALPFSDKHEETGDRHIEVNIYMLK
jgi:hypothetical protein